MPSMYYKYRNARSLQKAYTKPYAEKVDQVARKVSKLAQIINSELHSHDTSITSAITNTGTITSLSGVAQSDDQTGRTGRSILVKSVELRQFVNGNSIVGVSNIRSIIFSDSMNQGATPALTDILVTAAPTALRNVLSEKGRFKVLYDSFYVLNLPAGDGHMGVAKHKFLNLGNHHVFYEGTAAANVGKGSLWLLQVSNLSTNAPTQVSQARIRFYDN